MDDEDDRVEVLIIGAGSAGLAALRRIRQRTRDVLLVDPGPLGTTCARNGCMPSKALLEVAERYHARAGLAERGIRGGDGLDVDLHAVLRHVRGLRDHFTTGMIDTTRALAGEHLLTGRAEFSGPDRVRIGAREIAADTIVLATGSRPVVPAAWRQLPAERVLTTDDLFEREDLPPRLAVIGLGAIGLEVGQALARLGLEVTGFDLIEHIGGLTDPAVNRAAIAACSADFPLHLGSAAELTLDGDDLRVSAGERAVRVDAAVAALGRQPALAGLGLERLGVELDEHGQPPVEARTMRIPGTRVFLAGDANGQHPLLHEAVDDGYVAASNALATADSEFCSRVGLRIVFSDPQLAVVGRAWAELDREETVIGAADFSEQARARIHGSNRGRLQVYVDRSTHRLQGAELAVPAAEHLAHLLAAAIAREETVDDLLQLPWYHPTLEEGLREALRDAAVQLPETETGERPPLCDATPEAPLV